MNTGQMMLTVGAMVLLGVTVLSVNRTSSTHGTILRQTEIGIYATSLATSVVEEASGQNFDEVTVNDAITSTTVLTASSSLGPETGETTTPVSTINFDDFDDYNGLVKIDTIRGSDIFTTRASVNYVDVGSPNGSTTTRTFHKRLTVKVTGTATQDTITMSYIFSYFNFR
jgi:hypothetical protein